MNHKLECGVTASLLDSGARLANASNCAAVIGGAGVLLAHSLAARLMFVVPVLSWPAACYFSVRVAIDGSLFKELALSGEDSGPALDELLGGLGFLREKRERTIGDRSRGAVKLWNRLIAIAGMQIATLVAATIVDAWAR